MFSLFQLSKLCTKLDSLWNENKGLEILYLWLSFLKEESFSFLELGTTINLSKQYTFNIKQIENRKILQKKCEVESVSAPDSAECSSASALAAQPVHVKPSGEQNSVGKSSHRDGRGRGRGKIKSSSYLDGQSSTALPKQDLPMAEVKTFCRKSQQFSSRNLKNHDIEHDPRAVSCEALQTPLISYIVEFNRSRAEKEFQRNIYPCMICFEVSTRVFHFYYLVPYCNMHSTIFHDLV